MWIFKIHLIGSTPSGLIFSQTVHNISKHYLFFSLLEELEKNKSDNLKKKIEVRHMIQYNRVFASLKQHAHVEKTC